MTMPRRIDLSAVVRGSRQWFAAKVLAAVFASVVCGFIGNVVSRYVMETVWNESVDAGNWYRRAIFFLVAFFVALHLVVKTQWLYEQLFRFRWLLAGLLFAACVILQLHGSSLGVWAHWVQPAAPPIADSAPILGVLRPERTDEFMVNTPLAFSQSFSGYAPVNSIAEAWPTSMLTVVNQPVLDITLIAKPAFWGYVLLGNAYGLSWFWYGRLIVMFMITFELFMVITGTKRIWALTAAFMFTFAPFTQWWFDNFFVDLFIAGQLVILLTWYFFRIRNSVIKLVLTIGFALGVCNYAFSLYPAGMVPLAYVLLVLFVWVVIKGARCNSAEEQKLGVNLVFVGIATAVVAGLLGYWYITNRDAITTIQNTVYPGQRQETGGGTIGNLFNVWLNLRMPFYRTGAWSGGAIFPGFFPVGEILAIIYLIRTRLADKLLVALLCVNAFLIVFAAVGFPVWLAKISLLSYSHAWAVAVVSTSVSVMILVRSLAKWSGRLGERSSTNGRHILDSEERNLAPLNGHPATHSHRTVSIASHRAVGTITFFLQTYGLRRVVPILLILYTLVSGLPVNPLMRGISAVTQKPIYAEIQQLQAEDPGIWIATWPFSNYTIMAGAPTVNSTNIIPALERWKIFDPNGKFIDVYNRYGHVVIGFNTTTTTFSAPGEIFGVDLAMTDLRKLDVKYILLNENGDTAQSLPTLTWEGGHATLVYKEYEMSIYRIEYD